MKIDKLYCINLDNEKKRWNDIKHYCNKANIKINRFSAVDAKKINLDNYNKNIKIGDLACTQSHINVWNDAKKNNYKYIIVFEDDCIIPSNFWNKIDKINIYFDILFLGGGFVKGCIYNNNYIIPSITKLHENNNLGFFAYILNCNIIDKLINELLPYKNPIDVSIRGMSNLIIYYIYPHLITHNFNLESYRLYIDYNKKFYTDNIIKKYHQFEILKPIKFIISDKHISNINDIQIDMINNILYLETNSILQQNALYFIDKYTQSIPSNWSILIISNINIVKNGRIFICNTINNNNYYLLN